jgi:TatA/E family protein of Tat protein translocase
MLASVTSPEFLGVIFIALVVIFGGSQLPKIARNVGSAGKEFRKAQREAEEEEAAKKASQVVPPAVTAGPVVPAPPVVTATPPTVAAAPADDKVTISKAELAALLDERLGKADRGSTNEATGLNN